MLIALTITSGSLSQQYGLDGVEDDERVERERQVLDVEQVVLQLLQRVLDAGAVGVAHLCPTGESRPQNMPLTIEGDLSRQFGDKLRSFRTRADETHVTLEDIPQLRQFVEAAASQEPADRRHTNVAFLCRPHRARRFFGVGRHRSELMQREYAAELADALLVVQHCAWRCQPDKGRDHQHDRRRNDQTDGCSHDVDDALGRRQHPTLSETRRKDQPAGTEILERDFYRVLLIKEREDVYGNTVQFDFT